MKSMTKCILAIIAMAVPVSTISLQAGVSPEQADSILQEYLKIHWVPQWQGVYLPYAMWFCTEPSDTVYVHYYGESVFFVVNSYLYYVHSANIVPNAPSPQGLPHGDSAPKGEPFGWFAVAKETGELYIPSDYVSMTFDKEGWVLRDYYMGHDIAWTLNKKEADTSAIEFVKEKFGMDSSDAYTLYAYPDTATFSPFHHFYDSSQNSVVESIIVWSNLPAINMFFYFLVRESKEGTRTSEFAVYKEQGEICHEVYAYDNLLVPTELWTYPIVYTHLRRVGNEPVAEAALTEGAGRLHPNVPNPFLSATRLRYEIPENARSAELRIMDLQGRIVCVRALTSGQGEMEVDLDGREAGLYIGVLLVDGMPADRIRLVKCR